MSATYRFGQALGTSASTIIWRDHWNIRLGHPFRMGIVGIGVRGYRSFLAQLPGYFLSSLWGWFLQGDEAPPLFSPAIREYTPLFSPVISADTPSVLAWLAEQYPRGKGQPNGRFDFRPRGCGHRRSVLEIHYEPGRVAEFGQPVITILGEGCGPKGEFLPNFAL